MILAKNRNGQIGRQIPGVKFDAKIEAAQEGGRRGSVYISTRSIEEDQAYYGQKERQERAVGLRERLKNIAERGAFEARKAAKTEKIVRFQKLAAIDPMNEKLKAHYARQGSMGETMRVMNSVRPADFSSSGANPELVAGERMTGGDQWRADFRQHMIVGNPLTRDGNFGPAVTDYERFVQGTDVNQWNVVDTGQIAGGTMLGRYNGSKAPAGMGSQAMGACSFSSLSLSDYAACVAREAGDKLADSTLASVLKAAQTEVNKIIAGGGDAKVNPDGSITIRREGAPTQQTSMFGTVPKSVLWAGGITVGVIALLLVATQAKKLIKA